MLGQREESSERESPVPMTVHAIYMQVCGVAQEHERRKGLLETAAVHQEASTGLPSAP